MGTVVTQVAPMANLGDGGADLLKGLSLIYSQQSDLILGRKYYISLQHHHWVDEALHMFSFISIGYTGVPGPPLIVVSKDEGHEQGTTPEFNTRLLEYGYSNPDTPFNT